MNRILTQFHRDQYNHFKQQLVSSWGVNQRHIDKLDTQLKPIHKRYLSLACAATVIGHGARRNEYIEGVVEANYLCLVLAIKGLDNPSCVLLRQSIELVLKHIYFATHPVEYTWAQSREDYQDLTFQNLLQYQGRTEECQRFQLCHDICVVLNEWFGKMSRHVHVHSGGFMGYSKVGSAYQPKAQILKKLNERTKEVWPRLTAILLVHFTKRYFAASSTEQSVIMSGLSGNLRKQVNQCLADHK